MRLVGRPVEVYNYLEPLYNDYRKLRMQNLDGSYTLSYLDEVVDQMLHQDYLFDVALPRLPQRSGPFLVSPFGSVFVFTYCQVRGTSLHTGCSFWVSGAVSRHSCCDIADGLNWFLGNC